MSMEIVSRNTAAALVMIVLFVGSAVAQDLPSPSPPRPGPTIPQFPNIEPSENVKALSEASNKRQDDLRAVSEKSFNERLFLLEKINEKLATHNKELREAAIVRLDEIAKLRAEYTDRLLVAEAKRIDAIRAVDVGSAANLAARTTEQATALATVVNQSAEVLRNQVSRAAEDTRALVATTAATALQNQQQQFAAISTRISTLEQAGAEGKGKQSYQDPAIVALINEVRTLTQSRVDLAGVGSGRSDVIGWIAAGLTLLIAFAGFMFMAVRSKPNEAGKITIE